MSNLESSGIFKTTILEYLEKKAKEDVLFAETFKKENKNIDDCIRYILNFVKNSGCNGFDDCEIYSLAVHYYDEDNIDIGKQIDCKVVVNHKVELTDEEIKKAKEDALKKITDDYCKSLSVRNEKKNKELVNENTLF